MKFPNIEQLFEISEKVAVIDEKYIEIKLTLQICIGVV